MAIVKPLDRETVSSLEVHHFVLHSAARTVEEPVQLPLKDGTTLAVGVGEGGRSAVVLSEGLICQANSKNELMVHHSRCDLVLASKLY